MRPELARAYAECEALARTHYENFTVGSWLLPRSERRHLAALYAYARGADDLADEPAFEGDRFRLLDEWEGELDAALVGKPARPVFLAVANTLRERDLSDEPLRALLRAFRYDAAFEPFGDFAALLAYCRDSANPVGRLVLGLFGVRDPEALALSDQVCTGLQLANFWQDVSVDRARGRVYFPRADVAAFEGAADALGSGVPNEAFDALVRTHVDRARERLAAGEELAARLGPRAAIEIRMFAGGGERILDCVQGLGGEVLRTRPTVGRSTALGLLLRSVRRTFAGRPRRARPAAPQATGTKGRA